MNRIEVYYDGVNVQDFGDHPEVTGFTTNISFLKKAGITDYGQFIADTLPHTKGKPISFQLYADEDDMIKSTARKICSYGPNVFVKIPVIKTNELTNTTVIRDLHREGLQINVTAIFTKEQVLSVKDCFGKDILVIVSLFAGRVNDSGIDCSDLVAYAVDQFKDYPNVKILWAACRTVYNMFEAEKQGAHIVTVPDSVLSRMTRIGDDPYEASVAQVKAFQQDGMDGDIRFRD
jgi:transaldolase